MKHNQPPWQASSGGVQFLRLYKKDKNDSWPNAVSKDDLQPDWPQIVVLDLTAEQYADFMKDPAAFANKHSLYPDRIRGTAAMPKPPKGKGKSGKGSSLSYTVVAVHNHDCTLSTAGGVQN